MDWEKLTLLRQSLQLSLQMVDELLELRPEPEPEPEPEPVPPPEPPEPEPEPEDTRTVGWNVSWPTYWTLNQPWGDMFQRVSWQCKPEDQATSSFLPNGDQLEGRTQTQMSIDCRRYPPGEYYITWEGDGSISPDSFLVENGLEEQRILFRRRGKVFNIAVNDGGRRPVFADSFLRRMEGTACLRLMKLCHPNSNREVNAPGWFRVGNFIHKKLTPIDADEMGRLSPRIWLNFHHLDTIEEIRAWLESLAGIYETFGRTYEIYVEHSNEVWNNGFGYPAQKYYRDQGLDWHIEHTKRTEQIGHVAKDLFGEKAFCVLGGWFQDGKRHNRMCLDNHVGVIDHLAVAPYFGGVTARRNKDRTDLTVASLFDLVAAEEMENRALLDYHNRLTLDYGVGLVAYEGGSHCTHQNIDQVCREVNKSTVMRDLYVSHLSYWNSLSNTGIYCLFSDCGGLPWDHYNFERDPVGEPRASAASIVNQVRDS